MVNRLDDVVTGALEVLDSYGLEFCSMRRVASHLGVQPSALYHHVSDKQTLLALMADRIVADVKIPDEGTKAEKAATTAHALRAAMLSVRDGADVVATASAFRMGISALEEALTKAVADADVARALLLVVFGHTQATQMHRAAAAAGLVNDDPDLDPSFDRAIRIVLRTIG